jgi:hypothetical protein
MAKESGTKGVLDTRPGPGVGTSLDELAKGLASGTLSRGKALRWMGGALVGAALTSIPGVAWAAKPPSPPGGGGGNCAAGELKCRGICVNPQTNPNNCGGCFKTCGGAQICTGGQCVCPPGTCLSGGQCINATTTTNCGPTCATCGTGQGCCEGTCIELNTVANCGSCNNSCDVQAGEQCLSGRCRCPAGNTLCNGDCVNSACGTGKFFNVATCGCECFPNNVCTGTGGTIDPNTCACQCPSGKAFSPTSGCVCARTQSYITNCTSSGGSFNTNTCTCQCPFANGGPNQFGQCCSAGKVMNQSGFCVCDLPANYSTNCTSTGGSFDGNTCECDCPFLTAVCSDGTCSSGCF